MAWWSIGTNNAKKIIFLKHLFGALLMMTKLLTPKTPFSCIKDKQIYIYKMYAIYGHTFMPTPRNFEKVLMDPIRPNMSKNVKKIHFLNPFLGYFQKLETGSESMCRSVMAASFQMVLKSILA